MPAELGVNVDHVATVRQARGVAYPDPVTAASIAEMAGADQITTHIRCDRRHIQERDLEVLVATVQTRLNVEMAVEEEMLAIAARIRPHQVTLVPERPEEVTTEGGLDLTRPPIRAGVDAAVPRLRELGCSVAIFADPDLAQVEGTLGCGAGAIEFNTAAYAEATSKEQRRFEVERLRSCAEAAHQAGLYVAAGHGLHYHNIAELVALDLIEEFNIGHALIARAIFSGLDAAVRDMKALLG
jgi:pyridoxine 5-phosphate synthase